KLMRNQIGIAPVSIEKLPNGGAAWKLAREDERNETLRSGNTRRWRDKLTRHNTRIQFRKETESLTQQGCLYYLLALFRPLHRPSQVCIVGSRSVRPHGSYRRNRVRDVSDGHQC